jgi:hypothetical protein
MRAFRVDRTLLSASLSAFAIVLVAGCSGSGGTQSPIPSRANGSIVAVPATSLVSKSAFVAQAIAAETDVAGSQASTARATWPIGAQTATADVGINVEGVVDYSVSQQFVNAMRQARPWGSPSTPWDESVSQGGEVDADGWPTVDAGAVILCCTAADGSNANSGTQSELTGTYHLFFTGRATIGFPVYGGTIANQTYDAAKNRTSADITWAATPNDGGFSVFLNFTNTQRTPQSPVGSGITNVHLIRPQFAPNGQPWWTQPDQQFTTPFLTALSGYSTLRFMDWNATNGSPVVNWRDRTAETYATDQRQIASDGGWQPTGASWGEAIALANQTNEDMWINVPAMATDDYVTHLANVLHTYLHPNLHVYVEYSNEVWNSSFPQFQYNLSVAEAQAASNPAYKANCSPSDEYRWGQCRVAERLMQISNDFSHVFGHLQIGTRVRPVFATQIGNTYDLGGALAFIAATYGPPSSFFYGIAQAPYWSGDNSLANLTEGQELGNAESNLQATVPSSTAAFTAYAVAYGLHNFTYEGGPGMSGTQSLAAKVAANLDPQIGSQVTEALDDFFTRGGDMYVYYNEASAYGQYGMWGTTDDIFDLATPKIDAIAATRGSSQVRSVGAAVPGSIAALSYSFEADGGGYAQPQYFYFRNGETLSYLVDAPSAGVFAVTLTEGTYASTPSQATILVNTQIAGTIVVPVTNGPSATTTTAALDVALPAGLSVVSVAETSGEFGLYAVGISPPSGGAFRPASRVVAP